MTVGYMKDVATATSFTFLRLLFRWRGSVWKAIYWELLLWLLLFVNIRTFYEFILVDTQMKIVFEQIVTRCRSIINESRTVITFALGFYVSFVTNRWWNVFMTIPWPDTTALQLTAYLRSRGVKFQDEDKSLRQTIMRYLILSYVLVFRDVSLRIKKRFPTYDHLTPTLMTDEERAKLEKSTDSRHWVPIEWALGLLKSAERKGCIDSYHLAEISRTVLSYRQQLHDILSYDWISVPLVYVQAVNICTISYFMILCFSAQSIEAKNDQTGLPIYSIIEFVVFTGWLKTAFVMLNPFGLDDDDFEMDTLIERNLMVSLSYVTDFYDKPPKLVDMNVKLPHTLQSAAILKKANPMFGSAVTVEVPKYQQGLLNEKQSNMIGKMLSPAQSRANLQNAKLPIDEMGVQQTWNFNDDEMESKQPKGPVTSIRETAEKPTGYILNKEDLEAAVAKLLEKKLNEDKEEERIKTDKTQSVTYEEDVTQKSVRSKSEKNNKKKSGNAEIKSKVSMISDGSELQRKLREVKEKASSRSRLPSRQSSVRQEAATQKNSMESLTGGSKKLDLTQPTEPVKLSVESLRRVPSTAKIRKAPSRSTVKKMPE